MPLHPRFALLALALTLPGIGCDSAEGTPDAGGMDASRHDAGELPIDAGAVPACEGTPPACRLLSTSEDCMRVRGCGWTACGGFAVPCSDRRSEATCIQRGCRWDGSACRGTAVECALLTEADACRSQPGCTWTPVAQCRGEPTPCELLSADECAMQSGCRPYTPPTDAGPRDGGSRDGGPHDAWVPMCTIDAGPGCVAPTPPIAIPGCHPERGIECDGDWTGINPRTGTPFCNPACGADECCIPRDGRFTCHRRNDDGSCPAADIFIDPARIEGHTTLEWREIRGDSCELAEGCVAGTGMRRLLRFDTWTPNVGEADLYLGAPSRSSPVFLYSSCHGHYHFDTYAAYELLDASGCCVVAAGHKQAFCLMDLARHDPARGTDAPVYDCGYQGIQRGWQDVYGSSLDCQFVDVTGVPPGDYILRIRVNTEHILLESDYTNNEINVPVRID